MRLHVGEAQTLAVGQLRPRAAQDQSLRRRAHHRQQSDARLLQAAAIAAAAAGRERRVDRRQQPQRAGALGVRGVGLGAVPQQGGNNGGVGPRRRRRRVQRAPPQLARLIDCHRSDARLQQRFDDAELAEAAGQVKGGDRISADAAPGAVSL